ncbi:MAG: hypothetical protein OXI96_07990 [Acidimicrobiaceae bacterium]|nr:hypothetical protein [Acidimicrobiaceae bacterium]
MDAEKLIGSDLILLLLAAPTRWEHASNRIEGITRLEKFLFLIEQECDYQSHIEERFHFEAYNYGPYSKEVYEAVDILKEAGLIEEFRKLTDSVLDSAEELLYSDTTTEISYERQFSLTENGRTIANYLANQHPKLQKRISNLKDEYGDLTLQDLIFHVYTRYPDYAKNSVIRDKIMGTQF